MNPLFPDNRQQQSQDNHYLLPSGEQRRLEPLKRHQHPTPGEPTNPAVELIRTKINALYASEPSARKELAEAQFAQPPRSKHQQFMYEQTRQGNSLAEIQAAWHNYYAQLTDQEKREVWQEFYRMNAAQKTALQPETQGQPMAATASQHPLAAPAQTQLPTPHKAKHQNLSTVKKQVLKKIRASRSAQLKTKQHLQSLAFGLGMGTLVILIFLFGLFNQLVIAPFIRPGNAEATPIILNADTPAPSDTPQVIIPKINAQLPIVYGGQSLEEKEVQKALEDGVFHYPTTAVPGQNGNAAYFGHSSNNIFNKGKYKFAFVLLKELEPGDIFYLTHDKKVYTYKVFNKRVVNPDETWILDPVEGKAATAVLITCDPPGTTLRRLAVWGEQIGPDPGANTAPATPSPALQTQNLPGNGPTLWTRFWRWATPW